MMRNRLFSILFTEKAVLVERKLLPLTSCIFKTYRWYTPNEREEGHNESWKIYKSTYPSIMEAANEEITLYEYMTNIWKRAKTNRVACIQAETGEKFTYKDLLFTTERIAQLLYNLGEVRKGDVVCLALLNTIFYGPLVYGTLRLGGKVSTVNAVATPDTLAYHFKVNNAKVVIAMKFFQKNIEEAVKIVKEESKQEVSVFYIEEFARVQDKLDVPNTYNGLDGATPDDTIIIPFSSGTSGLPKGVQLTNRNLISNIMQVRSLIKSTENDVMLNILPFFHIFAFTCCLNCAMSNYTPQVIMLKYTVDSYLEVLHKYKITQAIVAPPILVSLLKNSEKVKKYDFPALTFIRSGSAPLSSEIEHACEKLFSHATVAQGYGLTEMSPVVTITSNIATACRTYGSAGQIIPDTEVRVVRVDDNQQSGSDVSAGIDVNDGEDGELWLRGPQMMKGYLQEEETVKCMQNGWFRTGDIGHVVKETNELVITDRLKELIKYKGFQVSPASLEWVLMVHPWVHDCVVIGVPDPRDVSFENSRALVVLKPELDQKDIARASDEIYRYIMHRMPPHKRLHGGVRIVSEIPRNSAGKVMRRQIRQSEIAFMKESQVAN